MGPDWHLESALQMLGMRSDSRLDAPVSRAGNMPRGCVQASAVVALPGSTRELYPRDCPSVEPYPSLHPAGPWPPSVGAGYDLTFSLPPNNLEEAIITTPKFRRCPVLGRFWDVHFTDAYRGEGTCPGLHT